MAKSNPINDTRSFLYLFAQLLGDINAISRGHILQRIGRRGAGKISGGGMGRIFDDWRV
jgi:hypothetical protein